MTYNINIEVFQGPFDLLFHLIEKNEVDIYDIPIAEITNQYLDYINTMQSFDLEVASEFLVMAATLLAIKAKMLLPRPVQGSDDEESCEADPREELVTKLLEYKKYKMIADYLHAKEEDWAKVFTRPNEEELYLAMFERNPLEGVTLEDLLSSLQAILHRAEPGAFVQEIPREELTVKDKMQDIIACIRKNQGGMEFSQLFRSGLNRQEIVVLFLALLELVRVQIVGIRQFKNFGKIIIFPREQEVS